MLLGRKVTKYLFRDGYRPGTFLFITMFSDIFLRIA